MAMDVLFFGFCFWMLVYGVSCYYRSMGKMGKNRVTAKNEQWVYDKDGALAVTWAHSADEAIEKFSRVYGEVERSDIYKMWYQKLFKVAVIK